MVFCTATRDKDEVVRLAFPPVVCGCVCKCVLREDVCGVAWVVCVQEGREYSLIIKITPFPPEHILPMPHHIHAHVIHIYIYTHKQQLETQASRPRLCLLLQCRTPYAVVIHSCTTDDGHYDA
jgi:hypothetical protein